MNWLKKLWQWLTQPRGGSTPVSNAPIDNTQEITVCWINASQDANGTLSLSYDDADKIVQALNIQASRDLADHWNNIDITHELLAQGQTPPNGSQTLIKAYFLANSDVADALGYHDVDPQGDPYIRVFTEPILQNGGSALSGSLSISSCASHEACEEAVDPSCGSVILAPNGDVWCVEVGDPVQNYFYDITLSDGSTVAVSDFVTPQFFEPAQAGAKYDFLGLATSPFAVCPGGYAIVNNGQIFGENYQDKGQKKTWPTARTYRRLHGGAEKK